MDAEAATAQLLALLGDENYSPMRKRALARAMGVPDADYRAFRQLLQELTKSGTILEGKGRFSLPASDEVARKQVPVPRPPEISGAAGASPAERPRPKAPVAPVAPKGARVGRIEVKRGGMGFLLSDPPGNDTFIAPEDLGGALSGDLVAVEMKRRVLRSGGRGGQGRRGRNGWGGAGWSRPAGRVVAVLERAHARIVGTFCTRLEDRELPRSLAGVVVPDTPGLSKELEVLAGDAGGARNHDKVTVELVEAAGTYRSGASPTARVVHVFGRAGEAEADIAAILENYNVRQEFPENVLRQADEIAEEIPEEELRRRTCYFEPVTFTIDPEDARDHDDAVALRREPDGSVTLLVHIADVSHYVPEGSAIDMEARERGTSVYLPGQVFPMLPPKLSNNLCSLKEGQVRLTKTARITFGPNLTPLEARIERSYIRSAAFLTYDQVKQALEEERPELVNRPSPCPLPEREGVARSPLPLREGVARSPLPLREGAGGGGEGEQIYESLCAMRQFAAALRQKRLATGSIDLDIPEAKLLLDEKMEVKGWVQEVHHWAHELIEDMMLAANRAVAEYLVEHEIPGLFRIHEEPDPEALRRFCEFVREFGISVHLPLDRLKLRAVLERVRGKEYAHTIHLALLTSLKQARYSAACYPHFALNFSRYLHFTSPIRRYPDLIVHRALDQRFAPGQALLPAHGKKRRGGEKSEEYFARLAFLRPLATHCSIRERAAEDAEEEVVKFRQLQFLRRNPKAVHPGLIVRVRDFGLFVELQDCHVEGLVHVKDMADDFYDYQENQHTLRGRRTRRAFRLGDKVSVHILRIDLGKKEVSLAIAD